jgi:hypothetical protein
MEKEIGKMAGVLGQLKGCPDSVFLGAAIDQVG